MAVGTVTLSCNKDPASPAPNTLSVSNNVAVSNNGAFYFNPVTDTTNFPTGWFGSCRVTAPGNAVSFVQMRFVGANNAASYEAVRGSGVGKVMIFPLIQKKVTSGSDLFGTAVTVQNLSTASAATVRFFYNGTSNFTVGPCTIAAGGSVTHNHRVDDPNTTGCNLNNATMANGWSGSLTVVSDDQPIDGFTQITNLSNPAGDTFMAHNANTSP